jgi:ABC-2 type transport system ATP-binding protein
LLNEFGLRRGEKVSTLSFGARIKLSLAMALSRDAELLLLDEPTIGLDVGSRRQLFTELLAFMQREDRTILISSHQLADVERFADHCAIVNNGKLMVSGRMDELVNRHSQLDVRATRDLAAVIEGARILERDGDRVRLLIDRANFKTSSLAAAGAEVINEVPLTLEELFLALLKK